MLKPEIKRKWLKALRSGEYKQGMGQLVRYGKNHDLFCCLGVLADIQGCAFDVDGPDPEDNPHVVSPKGYPYYDFDCKLPPRWAAGLTDDNQDTLARLNDAGAVHPDAAPGNPWSFRRIAEWIEKNL